MTPTEQQLHAYLDNELSADERALVKAYLRDHPEEAERLNQYALDADHLKRALLKQDTRHSNLLINVEKIQHKHRARTQRHVALAASVIFALGISWWGGWQWRDQHTAHSELPMSDALEAYRLFESAPAQRVSDTQLQQWFTSYFTGAALPPSLEKQGLTRVKSELMATSQGPAAFVMYRDQDGNTLMYFIRPPGTMRYLLPDGERHDGKLLARYWSDNNFNYALVSQKNMPIITDLELFSHRRTESKS